MRFLVQKLFPQILFFFVATCVYAQQASLSPEVAQMYKHAQEYIAIGNLKEAIVIYKQAIQLAPDNILLYKDLGKFLYQSGNYSEAAQTLASLAEKDAADAECYQLLAASLAVQDKIKEARSALQKGMERFPGSGILYHEKGTEYEHEGKPEAALNAWLDGIVKAPAYAYNYYEAACVYLGTEKVLWGLIYGEMYLYMEHDTTGDNKLKNSLFAAYKTMFDNIAEEDVPEYGKIKNNQSPGNFEEAVLRVYLSLTPVISDGITTENLTMVRTRFLMDWFSSYGDKYPFTLFSYEDNLARSGHFDMDNEWIFGDAESAVQFEAWNKFHEGDLKRFSEWQATNKLHPAATDFYNERNIDGLFNKIKNGQMPAPK